MVGNHVILDGAQELQCFNLTLKELASLVNKLLPLVEVKVLKWAKVAVEVVLWAEDVAEVPNLLAEVVRWLKVLEQKILPSLYKAHLILQTLTG
jgi:hypothetical protein